jgi:AGCS family alanine or glycine:cation symporter
MYEASAKLLFIPFILILVGSIILTFKSRFIQIRTLASMVKMLFYSALNRSQTATTHDTIPPHKALFTAMSTTIGIGNIVGPIIAMGLGGPGALAGFILATIFGAAATFTEVALAVTYRKKLPDGRVLGGPMQYLSVGLHPFLGKIYAYTGFILLVAWSSNQSNTISMVLEPYGISRYATGAFLALTVIFILIGGIKRIGSINEMLVPIMFCIYGAATSWIICCHADQIIPSFKLMWLSLWAPEAVLGAGTAIGLTQALRYGLARAFQSNEAGVGTSTFAHSMAETSNPTHQGILAMISVYSNGVLCLLSGLTVLVTGAWKLPGAKFDITMLTGIIDSHFPTIGPIILILSAFLFAYGTILGNGYNGSQCFLYVTNNRWVKFYYVLSAIVIFLGCISDVKFVWTVVDFLILPVAIPNTIGIILLAFKHKEIFKID